MFLKGGVCEKCLIPGAINQWEKLTPFTKGTITQVTRDSEREYSTKRNQFKLACRRYIFDFSTVSVDTRQCSSYYINFIYPGI